MSFMGQLLDYSYFYPDLATQLPTGSSDIFEQGDIKVTSGVEVSTSNFTLDVSDTSIRFEFLDTGLFTIAGFNGLVLTDLRSEINPIIGFSLNTNMKGLTASDISTFDDGVRINWQGTSLTSHTFIEITVIFEANQFFGSEFADNLSGTRFSDRIKGWAGDDVIRSDAVVSGFAKGAERSAAYGADALYGGAGIDTFIFAEGDTAAKKSKADTIFDFEARKGEVIDLSEWDANDRKDAHQSFDFIGADGFSGHAGELRYAKTAGHTWVQGDTDGDGSADFTIHLKGAMRLTEDNFAL